MTSELITGIAELTTNAGSGPGDVDGNRITDAALVIEDGRIAWLGAAGDAPDADARTDVGGR
ncbi:imidazolonepropionase, partial [Plantibacter sp. CFBP 13570]|nr:imidazolonepropionase [Plantibacter sp. CFBP 13570]